MKFIVPIITSLFVIVAILIVTVLGILVMKDISYAEARYRRCPRCGKRTRRKAKSEGKDSPPDSIWACSRCGNDIDEFGNKP